MHYNWLAILPEILLAGGGLALFCAGAFWSKRPAGFLFTVALCAVAGTGAATLLVQSETTTFLRMVDCSGYARFFTILFCSISAMTLLFSHQYSSARGFGGDEFYGTIPFATLGMILVASAVHWLIFFLGLELLSISFYVLIPIRKDNAVSNEAGMKYLIMGVVASAFLTFGIALLYAVTGTMDIAQSLRAETGADDVPGMILAVGLILVGIGFKISLVPFHVWTPDVYQGAPAPVTALLSTGSKVAIFAALLRLSLHTGSGLWPFYVPVIWILAASTMVVGNLAALGQSSVKRLLAYSSVAHMGYLLMALLALQHDGASAVMFYLSVYAIMDLGAFGLIGTLSPQEEDLDKLDDYKGIGYLYPWRSALLAICLFSLAGLPPFAGFIGKFVLFQAALKANLILLALIGIAAVIVSIYVYLKVVVLLYMHPAQRGLAIQKTGVCARIVCSVILVLIIGVGLAPSPLIALIMRIVDSFKNLT